MVLESQVVPEVFTILRVDVEPDDVAPVRQLLAAAEGTVADPEVVTGSGAGTVAVVAGFRLAGDATTTAVRVAAARRGGRPPRLVLSTGRYAHSRGYIERMRQMRELFEFAQMIIQTILSQVEDVTLSPSAPPDDDWTP